jgi:hypothetical protein
MAGKDLDVIRELEQPLQAAEEPLGTLPRLDSEVGTGRRADEERVAGEEGAVREEAAVLRTVAGGVDRADADGSDRDRVAVV